LRNDGSRDPIRVGVVVVRCGQCERAKREAELAHARAHDLEQQITDLHIQLRELNNSPSSSAPI
jgi:hypothetical protein